ncbi:leucine-rich melanocyte differentiation-associated protein-like [Actinia tenebrosa]|uniref:Leucine-rich melanocyte differentiation-associated protein-like n=1 Tax=Actinia tenebrosa TaxID=6105 RepID=A0A6P8IKM2_ACTTE|nr:leucine-rich melanocyte differentiation-associated protein-like [Actinia tenebrosa]
MAKKLQNGRLSLAYQELTVFPTQLIERHRTEVRELDLSHNKLVDMKFLQEFENLKTLVLDNNSITSRVQFTPVKQLETLWVNHNNITNLSVFIESVSKNFPNLKYFSMMHNNAAPSYFNGGTYQQYKDYRFYVISHLPNLLVVDDTAITEEEREEARKFYGTRRYSIKSTAKKKKR